MSSITNFRDIGGIKNKEGKQVIPKTFFRSGELSQLTKEQSTDLENTYRLAKIVDLRSQQEVSQRPDVDVPKTEYVHIDILKNVQDEGASMDDFAQIGTPENAQNYMKKLYKEITLDPTAQKGYQKFFEEILSLEAQEGLLFHCFAGKDRTGIGAALILESLSVPQTAIYADYLLTNQLRQKENQLLIQQAKASGLQALNLKALEVALNVDKSYLDEFYQTVAANYGSIDAYLTTALKLDQDSKKILQQRFLID